MKLHTIDMYDILSTTQKQKVGVTMLVFVVVMVTVIKVGIHERTQ